MASRCWSVSLPCRVDNRDTACACLGLPAKQTASAGHSGALGTGLQCAGSPGRGGTCRGPTSSAGKGAPGRVPHGSHVQAESLQVNWCWQSQEFGAGDGWKIMWL